MALVITTNLESKVVQRNLDAATNLLNLSIERMSTGYKINRANDNAAGFSIVDNWTTKIGSLDIAADNASMGKDLLTTMEENYSLLTGHLQRIRDLTEQAANGTYGSTSLKAIKAEIQSRLEEITRVSKNAEFNDIKLMSQGAPSTNGIKLQVGIDGTADSKISLVGALFSDATVNGLFKSDSALMAIVNSAYGSTPADLNTSEGYEALAAAFSGLKKDGTKYVPQTETGKKPSDTLASIDDVITAISERVTKIGASQNAVDSAISAIDVRSSNLTSSLSTLRDTDVAEESSRYIQAQILQQASATLLSTANQAPSIALNLV